LNKKIVCETKNWFEVTIFISFLDYIIHKVDSRYNDKLNSNITLKYLSPVYIHLYDTKSTLKSVKFHCEGIEVSEK
jgi:hypothetical protein